MRYALVVSAACFVTLATLIELFSRRSHAHFSCFLQCITSLKCVVAVMFLKIDCLEYMSHT